MGSLLSKVDDGCECAFEKYWPKNKWLQPAFVVPTLGVAHLAGQVYLKDVSCPVVPSSNYNFLLLGSLGAGLGLQLWTTFVQGLTMRKVLPRHQFGKVQASLFPKYFIFTNIAAFESLSCYLALCPPQSWKDESLWLGALLVASFKLSTLNLTCFNRNTIMYNQQMHAIEQANDEGADTIGQLAKDTKSEADAEYQRVKSKFYKFHGMASVTNLLALGATVGSVYLLAKRMKI